MKRRRSLHLHISTLCVSITNTIYNIRELEISLSGFSVVGAPMVFVYFLRDPISFLLSVGLS